MKLLLIGCAVILTVVIAVAHWQSSVLEAEIAAKYPPVGKFVEVNGTKVHYIEAGEGPPLVLIHGLSSNLMEMRATLVDQLAKHFHVVAFDRPGLGYTQVVDDISIAGQAMLLSDAASALGLSKPIVMGHSFGGAVALAWAVERPDHLSALLVLSGASHPLKDLPQSIVALLGNSVSGSVVATIQLLTSSGSSLEEAQVDAFSPQDVPENSVEAYGSWLSMRRFSAVENMRQLSELNAQLNALVKRYHDINVPVEIIHGDADLIVPYVSNGLALSKKIPKATLTTLEGIGHAPNETSPDIVEAAITRLSNIN